MTAPEREHERDPEVGRRLRRLSRRGFAAAGAAAVAGVAGLRWVANRPVEGGAPWPLRRILRANERLARAAFRDGGLAPGFPKSSAVEPRVNGLIGLQGPRMPMVVTGVEPEPEPDPALWRLKVAGPAGSRSFSIGEIRRLPKVEMTNELKCIEGWSVVVTWTGARLSDLARVSGLATRSGRAPEPGGVDGDLLRYVALSTPDGAYYVGLDAPSALHPQTLLCYAMNGAPLTPGHGAPLRLAIPIKYGIKNLKNIGTLRFTDDRPADYWAERGYDWYAGL